MEKKTLKELKDNLAKVDKYLSRKFDDEYENYGGVNIERLSQISAIDNAIDVIEELLAEIENAE